MQDLRSKIRIYYLSFFLFNMARTIPHAILTILLINDKNVTLSEIAIIQVAYMVAIILFEFPSGLISDLVSRKLTYIISIFTIIVSYFFIYFFESLGMLVLAWFLYGLSTSFMSGTIDAELINLIKINNYNLKSFKTKLTYIASFSSIVGAFIGSIFYLKVSVNIYIISLILFFVSIIVITFINIENRPILHKNIKKEILKLLIENKQALKSTALNKAIILIVVSPFFLQAFYQYWQVLYIDKNIAIYLFGYVYAIFHLANMIGAYVFNKINYKNLYSYIVLIFIFSLNIITSLFLTGVHFFLTFPIILVLYSVYSSNMYFQLNKETPKNVISSIISLVSTLVNIVSVFALLFISVLVENLYISYVYIVSITVFGILSALILILFKIKYKS